MSRGSYFLVYFDGACNIDDAEQSLRRTKMTVERDGDQIEVRWNDGPTLSIGLNAEPWVQSEAQETSANHRVPALAKCSRRFEVGFADLESVLDDYNTLFEVQATLQDLTKGWILLSWNGELLSPEH